ncbi:MAG: efflux RND transporter periplasmic adaptor subunit [Simkaniaceae bacterium]|nr:MAG: efflux RND transporter periplasmic adaptor subunit [Simkaniaceae bacterium]
MNRKYVLPTLAFFGLLFALFMVFYGAKTPPIPPIEFPPASPPYKHYVAGAGIVEAASENIKVGTPFSEIVTDVFVTVGQIAEKDTPLFQLNIETLNAEYEEAKQKRDVAKTKYEDQKTELSLYQSLKDKRAVSENEINKRYYSTEAALNELKEAEASMEVIASKIQRSTIRAPMNGQVLQVNIHVGESADVNPFDNEPHMLFGQTDPLHIRVEVDEDDAWRVQKGAPAVAYVRGNSSISVPLDFLYIEPYIIPKSALTGDNQERVDTRVLQIIYSFERGKLPIHPGQIMDIFIKGIPANERY